MRGHLFENFVIRGLKERYNQEKRVIYFSIVTAMTSKWIYCLKKAMNIVPLRSNRPKPTIPSLKPASNPLARY